MSDREHFLAMLYTMHQDCADAVVVLCGEDGMDRLNAAVGIFSRGAAPVIVLTGGLQDGDKMGADAMRETLIERGARPDAILCDTTARNTRDQACHIAALCQEKDWKQIVLVASHYHLPRAFLTVVKALQETGMDDSVRVLTAFPRAKWTDQLPGLSVTRQDRMADEFRKVEQYAEHVASYADGIAYLERWER